MQLLKIVPIARVCYALSMPLATLRMLVLILPVTLAAFGAPAATETTEPNPLELVGGLGAAAVIQTVVLVAAIIVLPPLLIYETVTGTPDGQEKVAPLEPSAP